MALITGKQPMSLLEIHEVTKQFGGLRALNHVSCTVEQGQITGLIGPNGAGKTTLFHLISGQVRPDTGRIVFDGELIDHLPSHAICQRGIARTFQMVRPFLRLTTLNNVMVAALFGRAHRLSWREAETVARRWLAFMGLEEKAELTASSLTLGERKRLEIARALATEPRLLLLDEAIAGLNPAEVGQIMERIREIRRSGVTIFLIEHVLKAVFGLSDKLIVLNYGEKIAEGQPEEVAANLEVIKAYLGQQWSGWEPRVVC